MRTNGVSESPSPAAPEAPRPGSPAAPPWPGLLPARSLGGLAGEYRAQVHERNVRLREAEARAYGEYLDRYLEGARRCRTADELRAYGKPAGVEAGLERGACLAEDRDLNHAFGVQQDALLRANRALADLILRLERRPVPLDVFFDAAVTAKVEVGGRTYGGKLSARGGAAPEVGAAGVAVQAGRVKLSADAGPASVKVELARGRIESVEVSARAAPGVRAFARQSRGAVEHGIAAGGKVGGDAGGPALHVEGRVSVGVTLLTPEVAGWVLSKGSFWDGSK